MKPLRSAGITDAPALERLIHAAFAKYVPRIGRRPAPMNADVPHAIEQGGWHLLDEEGSLVAAIRVVEEDDALHVSEVVVSPTTQGRGLGRALLEWAEERARSSDLAALTLYTNAAMHENIGLYQHLGFEETGRGSTDGFDRVFFRKEVGPAS